MSTVFTPSDADAPPVDTHVPPSFVLDVHSVLSGEDFDQLCRDNPDTRMELTAKGELILMAPTGSKTGLRNSELNRQFANWAKADGTGLVFDSSTGFVLPNGARRSPDVAWVVRGRWDALTEAEQETFAPLCPDFVIDLRSPSDDLTMLREKMLEYIANGARMAWLIDPMRRRVYIYRPNRDMELLEEPERVSGEPELPGFVLYMKDLW